jgi:hypothetical protein
MKYISYTLFGTQPKYYIGAEKNIELNKKLLPDWVTVIYYNEKNILDGWVEKLSSLGAEMRNITNFSFSDKDTIQYPYFWRFFSLLNDGISIVRDLDSRVSDREVEYINRWLNSECDYFIIRDHPWHSPVPSGLFGIKSKIKEFEDHFINFINTSDLRWGTDQEILHQYMENIDKNNIFYCGLDRVDTYIPRNDKNFFIGMQIDENDNPLKPNAEVALSFLAELNY